jgi:hypothetical protein
MKIHPIWSPCSPERYKEEYDRRAEQESHENPGKKWHPRKKWPKTGHYNSLTFVK